MTREQFLREMAEEEVKEHLAAEQRADDLKKYGRVKMFFWDLYVWFRDAYRRFVVEHSGATTAPDRPGAHVY